MDDFYETAGGLFKTGLDGWSAYEKYSGSQGNSGPSAVYSSSSGGSAATSASAPAQSAAGGGTMMMAVVALLVALLLFMIFRG